RGLRCLLLCFIYTVNGVTQIPDILFLRKGSSAELSCSHSMGSSYYQMYWYRQHLGEPIQLIVLTMAGSDPKDFNAEKYSPVKTEVQSGSLTVKKLEDDDSAVYFCSVSMHSEPDSLQGSTKTSCIPLSTSRQLAHN
uniref:Ig-like domain-containing protein n=1 Tax=Denticeps clupeoides TaxID=299321 RepID=A0AAY4AGP9_9TELE